MTPLRCPLCGGAIVGEFCTRCGRRGRRVDNFAECDVGVPVDIGWGVIVLNADETATRTCKGCGASARSPVGRDGEVARLAFVHDDDCPVLARIMRDDEPPSIVCPLCGFRSYNPNDIAMRYCGGCHRFLDDVRR